ncbi:hypothetical protein ACHAXM_001597 [Skeletonema potamos]
MKKGIVCGLIRQYKLQNQNTLPSDYINQQATFPLPTICTPWMEQLFLHWKYHPNHIPCKQHPQIYDKSCKDIFEGIGIKKLTITYSRAPNLCSELTRAKLNQAPGKDNEASKYYL